MRAFVVPCTTTRSAIKDTVWYDTDIELHLLRHKQHRTRTIWYIRYSFHVHAVVWDWITRRRGDEMFIDCAHRVTSYIIYGCETCMLKHSSAKVYRPPDFKRIASMAPLNSRGKQSRDFSNCYNLFKLKNENWFYLQHSKTGLTTHRGTPGHFFFFFVSM